jgi:hypothetical protein
LWSKSLRKVGADSIRSGRGDVAGSHRVRPHTMGRHFGSRYTIRLATQAIISLDVALDAVEQIRRIVPAGFFSTVTYAVLFPLLGKNIKSSKTLQVSQFPP